MRRRLIYIFSVIAMFLVLQILLAPFLNELVTTGILIKDEANLVFMSFSFLVSIFLAIAMIYEGRHYEMVFTVSIIVIITRVVDAYRYGIFPSQTFEGNIVSLFGGLLIFAFGVPIAKKMIFRNRVGVYLILVGVFTMIRFPYFADALYFYYRKFTILDAGQSTYYNGIMVVYYIIVLFQLLALDGMIKDNIETRKYRD